MKHIIRIENYYVRAFLVFLVFPINLVFGLIIPNLHISARRKRMCQFEFWDNNWNIFWACVEGAFVDMPIDKL